jgi:hypothetical protein
MVTWLNGYMAKWLDILRIILFGSTWNLEPGTWNPACMQAGTRNHVLMYIRT